MCILKSAMLHKEQMTNINKREKDALDNLVDQMDLDGEELFGEDGPVKDLTARFLNRANTAIPG